RARRDVGYGPAHAVAPGLRTGRTVHRAGGAAGCHACGTRGINRNAAVRGRPWCAAPVCTAASVPGMRIAVLDDYQQVAADFAEWDSLGAAVDFFTQHIADRDELVRKLTGYDVVVAMRERTAFPAEVLERLSELKLLVSTGRRNAAIDVAAAQRLGIVVSATGYVPYPTAEHTWALILAAMRHIPTEAHAMGAGGWQTTVGHDLHGRAL